MKTSGAGRASRRGLLQAGAALIAGGSAAHAATRIGSESWWAQQEKLAQNIVQYQQTPKDGNKCSACVNWEAPNSCKIVAGTINPEGWCVAFAPKSG